MSDTNNLLAALSKAQAAMAGAKKDSTNPHFKNRYADLASVWDACRKPLTDNGLSVAQFTVVKDNAVVLVTRLMHANGGAIEGELPLPAGKNMQELGSALTYARRYGLAAMVGVAPEDDDGNAASARPEQAKAAGSVLVPPVGFEDWADTLAAAADTGTVALRETWTKAKPEYRAHLTNTNSRRMDELKKIAAAVDAVVPA
jgi:hypothetical protein